MTDSEKIPAETTSRNFEPENSNRETIQREQSEQLCQLLKTINGTNRFWTDRFAAHGVDVSTIQTTDDLHRLPFTTKADLVRDHQWHAPYGSNLTGELADYSRMHQTSGTTGSPMRWLDTPDSWNWFMRCWAQIYRVIGLQPDDRVMFPFSFGPFIGFWAAFEGAGQQGMLCLPGGGLSSQARLAMILDNAATVLCCTPTYALRLAEVAREEGIDLTESTVRAIVVAGEPGGSIPATRQRIESAWNARLFDHWGMTEIGSLGIECVEHPGGLHILETECIAEIIDPKTEQPVEPGTIGELVITNLGRIDSPLIRYRTGDLVRADSLLENSLPEKNSVCQCGRELLRLDGGILGRTDEMITIRGNNLFPSSLEAILREFHDIVEYRVDVKTVRSMREIEIQIEPIAELTSNTALEKLQTELLRSIKDRLNFQAKIVTVLPGTLPRFELKARRFFRHDTE